MKVKTLKRCNNRNANNRNANNRNANNRNAKIKSKKKTLGHCSPRNNSETLTCFSRPSLKRIIKYWNEGNTKNLIVYSKDESRDTLWYKINEKLKAICDNEYCWLKQPFISNRSIVSDDYRPEMPKTWSSNKIEWLTTSDIEKVMKQYMKKHEDFLFVGAVPIDFDKQISPGLCVVNELCKIKVKTLLKRGLHKLGIVFNLDPHDKPGTHWVSFFGNLKEGNLYYFDSYGFNPPKEVKELIDKLMTQGKENNVTMNYHQNKIRHQYKHSECGVYSINFIESMLEGKSFDLFSKKKIEDDDMVKHRDRYYIKYL